MQQTPETDNGVRCYAVKKRGISDAPKPRQQSRGVALADLIAEVESTEAGRQEMADGRKLVAQTLYAHEPLSLQVLRMRLGLSQTGLANKMETTQARISIYERGVEHPEFGMMLRMCEALNVDMNTLADALKYASDRRSKKDA